MKHERVVLVGLFTTYISLAFVEIRVSMILMQRDAYSLLL